MPSVDYGVSVRTILLPDGRFLGWQCNILLLHTTSTIVDNFGLAGHSIVRVPVGTLIELLYCFFQGCCILIAPRMSVKSLIMYRGVYVSHFKKNECSPFARFWGEGEEACNVVF
jgi:hypothetical protein